MLKKKLIENDRGGIAFLAAITFPATCGLLSLGYDATQGYMVRARIQATSDLAAASALMAYKEARSDPTNSNPQSVIVPVGEAVARANGIDPSQITFEFFDNYNGSGRSAVRATARGSVPVTLGRVIAPNLARYDITTASTAAMVPPKAPPCLYALSGSGYTVSTSGSSQLQATNCAIVTNGNMNADGNSRISGASVDMGGSKTIGGTSEIRADPGVISERVQEPIVDPLASNADISAGLAKIGPLVWRADDTSEYALPSRSPVFPSGAAFVNYTFTGDSSESSNVASYRAPGTRTYNMPPGNYYAGSMIIGSNVSVTFTTNPTTPTKITAMNTIENSGSLTVQGNPQNEINIWAGFSGLGTVALGDALYYRIINTNNTINNGNVLLKNVTIGNGTLDINDKLIIDNGGDVTIGNGEHRFNAIEVLSGSKLRVGTGSFNSSGGIKLAFGGASYMWIGGGDKYRIRKIPGSNDAILMDGSSILLMEDGTEFYVQGNIHQIDGGTRLVLPRANPHKIEGSLLMVGGVSLGAGPYYVMGDVTNGIGTQPNPWPYTATWVPGSPTYGAGFTTSSTVGRGVTFFTPSTSTIGFAGGARVDLAAPTAAPTNGAILNVLFASQTTTPVVIGQGALVNLGGWFWTPNTSVSIEDGVRVASNDCFRLVAQTISATGDGRIGATCSGLNLTQQQDVALVK